jgi:hypothetical protein
LDVHWLLNIAIEPYILQYVTAGDGEMNEKRVYYFIISFLFIRARIMCVFKKKKQKNNVRELEKLLGSAMQD